MFHPHGPTFWELARQALSSTEGGYDLLAPKFDYTPFRSPDEILVPVARYVEERPPTRALDLCTGTGAMLAALGPVCRERAVGLDFSRGMLREAHRKLGRATPLVCATAEAPPFEGRFDLVTCSSALGHFRGRERELVAGVGRVLAPGGRFVFVTSRKPRRLSRHYVLSAAFNAAMHLRNAVWSPAFVMFYLTFLLEDARALLESAGFDVAVVEGRFPSPWERYVIVDARRAP